LVLFKDANYDPFRSSCTFDVQANMIFSDK